MPNPAAGGHLGAAIFQATCHCTFASAYPYAIGPRLGVAFAIDEKTVFRGGWGFAYGYPNDLTLQNTANIINTPTGINSYLQLNALGTIPQPVWPNFDPGQTPLPGGTASGFLSYIDPHAARLSRQNQWSIGIQREITHKRLSLQLRAEFVNIFNRTQIGNPSTTAPGAAASHNAYGQYTAGFGVINLAVAGAQTAPTATLNALVGQLYQLPRTGTLIARFTF